MFPAFEMLCRNVCLGDFHFDKVQSYQVVCGFLVEILKASDLFLFFWDLC